MARQRGTPKTGGRRAGTPNKRTLDGEAWARAIVDDTAVRQALLDLARAGTLPPDLMKTLLAYAFGKPPDVVSPDDDRAPRTVQITF